MANEDNPQDKTISVKLKKVQVDWLEEKCKKEGRHYSEILRSLIATRMYREQQGLD